MNHERNHSSAGFSFLEMLAALAATLIVLGTVFGLLTRSTVSNAVEMERTDLQGQARHALELLSRDVLLAGTDVPPEFPPFRASGPVLLQSGDRIEILGNLRGDASGSGPSPVETFDGYTARLAYPPQFVAGDLVLFFDDKPTGGSWIVGVVRNVRNEPLPEIDIVTERGATVVGPSGSVTLPQDVGRYNRILDGFPISGYVTPISVVAYEVAKDAATTGEGGGGVLLRSVNWGEPLQVAAIESMEIRYFVGGTFSGPGFEYDRRPPKSYVRPQGGPVGPQGSPPPSSEFDSSRDAPPTRDVPPKERNEPRYTDVELGSPPAPQPDPRKKIDENSVIRGVRITVTSQSRRGNLPGAEHLPSDSADSTSYIRQTLSTRVAPRNLLNQASRREMAAESSELEESPRRFAPRR